MSPNSRLTDYLDLVRRRKVLFFSVLIGFVAIVMAVTYHVDPVYESTVTLMIEANDPTSRFSLLQTQQFSRQSIAINNDVEVIRSRRLMTEVVNRLDAGDPLQQFDRLRAAQADPVEWLRRTTSVGLIKATDVIELTAEAGDPDEAERIANTIAEAYIDYSRQEAQSRDKRVKQFLEGQVNQARGRLAVTEKSLKDFQEQHGVANIDDETEAAITQLVKFEATSRTNEVELGSRRERLQLLVEQRRAAAGSLADATGEVSGPLTAALREELSRVMALYVRFQAEGYDTRHEKMQELDGKIALFRQRLSDEALAMTADEHRSSDPVRRLDRLTEQIITEEVEIATLEARNAALAGVVRDYQQRLEGLPSKAHSLAQLRRAAEVEEQILVMLHQRYEEARIEEAAVESRGRVIDPAVAPKFPVRPRPLLSLALGLVFGVGLAIGACAASRPLQRYIDSSEMAHQLTGLKIIGRIPHLTGEPTGAKGHSRLVRKFLGNASQPIERGPTLVLSHSHGSEVVEAYRSLRTMLQFSTESGAPRTILVTSAGPGDGKTTTAANLAVTFAASGQRVLLIDADMRKPRVHGMFSMNVEGGLREVLTAEIPLGEATRRSTVGNLDIMTAGATTPNPAELLGSNALTELIQQLREEYRYVIIDSPPVLPVTDPAILSTRVDTTVFVVRDGSTPKAALEYGIGVLRCLPIKLAGIIYNEDAAEGRDRPYSYGYGYGYGDRKSRGGGDGKGEWITDGALPGDKKKRREKLPKAA